MNDLFSYTLHAGPTRTTSTQVALDDLTMVTTKLLGDTGSNMDISVTTGSLSRGGVFSILTDTRIVVVKVSITDTVTDKDTGEDVTEHTNLKLPDFGDPVAIFRGGKRFYLYQASGKTINLPRDKTTLFRIKYNRYVAPEPIPTTIPKMKYVGILTEYQGDIHAPHVLDANTAYYYDRKVHTGAGSNNLEGEYVAEGDYLVLPMDPKIGDIVEVSIVYNGHSTPSDPVYYFKTAGSDKLNGQVNLDWYYMHGATVSFAFTGNDHLGWVGLVTSNIS